MSDVVKKIFHFVRHHSKELTVAFLLAIVAAVFLEYTSIGDFIREKKITDILKQRLAATAIVIAQDKSGNTSQGSGFFIDSQGTLVTNYHVIKGMDSNTIEAEMNSHAYYKIKKIIGISKENDIAILQFDAPNTPYVQEGNSDQVESGQVVYAIGAPLGLESSVSQGIISNPARDLNGKKFIQFTAPISSGNSGGGLFSQGGVVVGITARSIIIPPDLQKEANAQNLNFAVPINDVKVLQTGQSDPIFTSNSPEYYYALGTLADNKKDFTTAMSYYQQAIGIDDQYADAYIGLGGDYYELGRFDLELANYLKATRIDTKNADNFYLLATAYEDTGQYDNAISAYLKTLTIDPTYKDALHDLAIMYAAEGQTSKAAELVPKLTVLDKGWGDELQMLLKGR